VEPIAEQESEAFLPLLFLDKREGDRVAADGGSQPADALETGAGLETPLALEGAVAEPEAPQSEVSEASPPDALPAEAETPVSRPPSPPAAELALPLAGEADAEMRVAVTAPDVLTQEEDQQAPPLAEGTGTGAAEADFDRRSVDEHREPPGILDPMAPETPGVTPAEAEAAQPEPGPPEPKVQPPAPLLPDVEAPQVPAQGAQGEVAPVPAESWAEPVATAAPPAFQLEEQAQRLQPAWTPSHPSGEAMRGVLPYARRALSYLGLALKGAVAVTLGFVVLILTLVVLYRWVDPPMSTLMLGQRLMGMPIERRWAPLESISPHLIRAVVLSEDGGFCRHRGVDLTALGEAIETDRGGSTITMQVVKNLFLWPSRSYVRKAIEICLAYFVELVWPKRRILEIYLNIAEWGDGVFGAEAAARRHFLKSAARLTAEEAALLAVSLPNPVERMPASPSITTRRLAVRLLTRMNLSQANLACVRAPRRVTAHGG
jgi:monofunctional glycosyltransferase